MKQWESKIDNIRAMAILLVVFGHSIILYSPEWSTYTTHNEVRLLAVIKDYINVIQMPLFFSLSGYLFFYTFKRQNNILKFLIQKIKRLLIPYLIIAFAYMLPIRMILNVYDGLTAFDIWFKGIILGFNNGHLWFLPALFTEFLIMYIIFRILDSFQINNETVDIILLILLLVINRMSFMFVLPYFKDAGYYLIFFYAGYLIHKYNNVLNLIKEHKCLKLSSIVVCCLLWTVTAVYYQNEIARCVIALLLLIMIYSMMYSKTNKIFNFLSKNSFGIYLFHSPLIYITYSFIADASPWIVVATNFFVFGTVSCILTIIIRKSPLRFVIGE